MTLELFAANEVGDCKLRVGQQFAHRVVLLLVDKAHYLAVVLRDRVAHTVVVIEFGLLPQPSHLVRHPLPAKPVDGVVKFFCKMLVQSLVCSVELSDAAQSHFVYIVPVRGVSGVQLQRECHL